MALTPRLRWLLLSDIHFRLRDFERIRQTAEWIVSLTRQTPGISRVVVCGDVLTSRSMQPTAVLSAAYRFISDLSRSVPHVNVILGNHDLAYRRDYGTTALEALNMSHLRPFISLHDGVGSFNWDGRRVLVLPFREDQTELTTAVADLNLDEAAQTIAFAHLAINRAVTQRHVVRNDSGDTGHSSNQPAPSVGHEDRLKGSVTYLGAPLQLTWADLYDEGRGVVLLNPATLEHELIVNPHAIGYITVEASEALGDKIDALAVRGKHVMILGKLTQFQFWTTRDKLLSLGAESVREPQSTRALRDVSSSSAYSSLGAFVPESDRDVALTSGESSHLLEEASEPGVDELSAISESDDVQSVEIDPVEHVRDYVLSLSLESADEEKMIQLGQKLILAPESTASLEGDAVGYETLLDPKYAITTQGDLSTPTKPVFVARPRSIVISNFLGVQEECTIDFDGDLGRGLTFVVGRNGSGKSTLFEAVVWCQFGRCFRKGLLAGDVINDATGKNCMVSLSFSNGYAITRYRKHSSHGNRVVVSLHGVDQPQFEHGEARATQAALDELLGIDYEKYIKTVVLEQESAASFLTSTPAQRHELIESTLRLSGLDKSAGLSRRMLREIDDDATALRSRINAVEETVSFITGRISNGERQLKRLRIEEEGARKAIDLIQKESKRHRTHHELDEDLKELSEKLEGLKPKIRESQQAVEQAESVLKEVEISEDVATLQSALDRSIRKTENQCQALQDDLSRLNPPPPARTTSSLYRHALRTISHLGFKTSTNRMVLRSIRICLVSLERISNSLGNLLGQVIPSISKRQQDAIAFKRIRLKLAEGESDIVRLIKERNEAHARVALDRNLDEQYVSSLSNKLLDVDARDMRKRLSLSFERHSELLNERSSLQEMQNEHQRERAKIDKAARKQQSFLQNLAKKEQEIATYQQLIEEETQMLKEKRASHAEIEAEIESLMSTRELFAFWEDSLSRRSTKSSTTLRFRNYILDKSLQEVNTIASNILLLLYENTRHARELTKGMLRTIIAADPEFDQGSGGAPAPALLDPTLGITKTLSYAKRSAGERKRIDLAVFFALVQIAQAHSTHRARYMLVDEVFDSLDAAGQAAVVRRCSKLMSRTDFQLVVTHSESLTGSARDTTNDENGDDGESRFSVLSAAMTEKGTKFSHSIA
ncbi:hypothetical protein EKO27_g5732 [Xylaria grammica]|uniref:Rad50/SbcC-type AAA domain-containing protein n=1 Tax=Xylaria grammica TaxID=363999 RepID=A0A439D4P5_9PEZI|nr:hypothetical protein EKO27_g5732 [Xylaria grammica]